MAGICEDSSTALRAWLAELRPRVIEPTVARQIQAIRRLLVDFDTLRAEIDAWPKRPPTQERKTAAINAVLDLREKAQTYAAQFERRI